MENLDVMLVPLRAAAGDRQLPAAPGSGAGGAGRGLAAGQGFIAVVKALRALNFHILTERAGIDGFLQQGGTEEGHDRVDRHHRLRAGADRVCHRVQQPWLTQVTDLLGKVLLFVPRVLVALLVVVFGSYFSRFVANAVQRYFRVAGISDAEILGRVARYAVMVFVLLLAIDHLDIGGGLIQQTFLILLAGLVFAAALALGLGARERAAQLIERWFPRDPPGRDDEPGFARTRRRRLHAGLAGAAATQPDAARHPGCQRTDAAGGAATRIFGRDAAICVMAMCGSGVDALEQGAVASLEALVAQQAPNGQIPKYVDPEGRDADFWYLGCIDATLWWLIAVDHVRRAGRVAPRHWQAGVDRAIGWLLAQEHQRLRLLQQNEASDWADIMPRSGYVLYTNALWFDVKRRYAMADAEATRHQFNHLVAPVPRVLPEYHRARLLRPAARRGRRDPGMYLSFVNLAVAGHEGDVFGNLMAVLNGLADAEKSLRIVRTIDAAGAAQPYPVRVVLHPLSRQHGLWRPYMARPAGSVHQ
jgi:hypothetical protein